MSFRRNKFGGFRGSPDPLDEAGADGAGGGGAWEELAARHPQLAAELGRHAWGARKRRGSQDRLASDFAREPRSRHFRDFFFDDIPPEFREHIPNRWDRHFEPDEFEVVTPHAHHSPPSQASSAGREAPRVQRQLSSDKATQTLEPEAPAPSGQNSFLPQYGLRNTVDLGQKTAAEPGKLDEESARNQRSMSAPPESRFPPRHASPAAGNPPPQHQHQASQEDSSGGKQPTVRHIPIFVEGRDEPVINTMKDTAPNFAETRATPPKEEYFANHDMPQGFHPTPHFSRAFGSPFKGFSNRNVGGFAPKGFKEQPQPPPQPQAQAQQNFRQPSPQRQTAHEAPNHKVHNQQQQKQPQQQQPQANHQQPEPHSPEPPRHQPCPNDPILKIQLIQKDVLELMTQVENFKGKSKQQKEYAYLDEMLTRNLIKLDDIETEGKENIRLARKEAIKCIQKCIAVLEAKANEAEARANEAARNNEEVKMESDTSQEVPNGETNEVPQADSEMKDSASPSVENKEDKKEEPKDEKAAVKKKKNKTKDKSPSGQKMEVDKAAEQKDQEKPSEEPGKGDQPNPQAEQSQSMEV